MRYAPEFFNRHSLVEMRGVILSPNGGLTVDERWDIETKWLAERIKFPETGVVIDYGCGIGRMSAAIQRPVIGVDISLPMLMQAVAYVNRQDFMPVSPSALRELVLSGFRSSGAMAIWSLQHVHDLPETIEILMTGLRPGAPFWMLDLCERHIPAAKEDGELCMVDDGSDVLKALVHWCVVETAEKLDVWKEPLANPGWLYKFTRRSA